MRRAVKTVSEHGYDKLAASDELHLKLAVPEHLARCKFYPSKDGEFELIEVEKRA